MATNQLTRRTILRTTVATAALAVPVALPALASPAGDPVLALFAEWEAVNEAVIDGSWEMKEAEDAFKTQHGEAVGIHNSMVDGWFKGDLYAPLRDKLKAAIDDSWTIREDAEAAAGLTALSERHNQLGFAEQALIDRIKATPATTPAGLAAKLELALAHSDYDPDSDISGKDYPWSLILAVIEELKAGGAS